MESNRSVSPVSGVSYDLPSSGNDEGLARFLDNTQGRPSVVVQGLGYVGTVMALVIANCVRQNFAVIGVDRPTSEAFWKIGDINQGFCPVLSSDPKVKEYFDCAQNNKSFYATHDHQAFAYADVIVVDINLDITKEKSADGRIVGSAVGMESFKRALMAIAMKCREDVLILIETTVPPGTCSKVIEPIIKGCLAQRGLPDDQFKLGHSYERVMPGPNYIDSIENFYRVYSGVNEVSAQATEKFLRTIISTEQYPLTRLATTTASEMAKVLENSYRATNIGFIAEWSRFAEAAGVDLHEIVAAIKQRPTHANLMSPGIGVGGSCLPKDPVLASWASETFFGLPEGLETSLRAVEINDAMPVYAHAYFCHCMASFLRQPLKILLLGVSYGPGIADTRCSPVYSFAMKLLEDGHNLTYHDPYVAYWREMAVTVSTDLQGVLIEDFDAVVICTAHREYTEGRLLYQTLNQKKAKPILVDTVGLLASAELAEGYQPGENFFVLGVGYS